MNIPIKNDPNERIVRESPRVRKNEPVDNKFQTEMDSTKSTARLKKHSKNLDSESDEELGAIKEDTREQVSLFDLSAGSNKKKGIPAGFVPDQAAENQVNKTVEGMPLPDPSLLMGSMAQAKIEKQPSDAINKLQELVQKMIAEIQQMEMKGKTDTIVTLNNPPLFKGAHLVMTSFDSAKGELNIAFENL